MNEIFDLLVRLARDFEIVKAHILSMTKSRIVQFKETWIDSQAVTQTLGIGKRSLQTLRDSGTLPYSRINGKIFYKVTDIATLLEANYTGSKPAKRGTK
jgi:hypothetical protein